MSSNYTKDNTTNKKKSICSTDEKRITIRQNDLLLSDKIDNDDNHSYTNTNSQNTLTSNHADTNYKLYPIREEDNENETSDDDDK